MPSCTSAFTKSGVLLGQTNFCQIEHFSIFQISSITNDQDGLKISDRYVMFPGTSYDLNKNMSLGRCGKTGIITLLKRT